MTRGAVSGFAAIASRVAFVAAAATAVAAQLSAVAGPPGYVVPFALGLGTGVGLGLHEAAHAASLRGVPSALVLRGRRTYVLHAPVGATRRSVVAAAGPLTVAVVGLALIQGGRRRARRSSRFSACRWPFTHSRSRLRVATAGSHAGSEGVPARSVRRRRRRLRPGRGCSPSPSQAGGRTLDISLGPLVLVVVARHGPETAMTFGAGLVALAVAGGLANVAAAAAVSRRADGMSDRVD